MDDDRQIMRGSGAGLLEFLDRAMERGDMNRETARGFRIASKQILEIESQDLASIDVRTLDVENLLDRFVNLKRADFGDRSLGTYKSRFRSSVTMYVSWLDGDTAWKGRLGPGSRRASRQSARKGSDRKQTHMPQAEGTAQEVATSERASKPDIADPVADHRLMTYDFALRPDLIVRVTLPIDLSPEDAERITNFIKALAFSPSRPGSTSASGT